MAPKRRIAPRPAARVRPDGTVDLRLGRRKIGFVAPEIFTEGWAKNATTARGKMPGFQGIVVLPVGRIGLKTSVKETPQGLDLSFTLVPLETVKAIHVRLVVNLPYADWEGLAFRLGNTKGLAPLKAPKNNRLAQGRGVLTLGPNPRHGDVALVLKAPRLTTVLQDNRQWTPYLHAFVTGNEKSELAWTWHTDRPKTYAFTLTFR